MTPSHCFVPGTHAPVHAPAVQTNSQASALCQAPVASQVWGTRPSHFLVPGTQVPGAAPATRADHAPDDVLILPWNIAAEIGPIIRELVPDAEVWVAVPRMRAV